MIIKNIYYQIRSVGCVWELIPKDYYIAAEIHWRMCWVYGEHGWVMFLFVNSVESLKMAKFKMHTNSPKQTKTI